MEQRYWRKKPSSVVPSLSFMPAGQGMDGQIWCQIADWERTLDSFTWGLCSFSSTLSRKLGLSSSSLTLPCLQRDWGMRFRRRTLHLSYIVWWQRIFSNNPVVPVSSRSILTGTWFCFRRRRFHLCYSVRWHRLVSNYPVVPVSSRWTGRWAGLLVVGFLSASPVNNGRKPQLKEALVAA